MITNRYVSVFVIAACIAASFVLFGCEEAKDPVSPDDTTPTPGMTPTPFATPTPEPTPDSAMWGYINGRARVLVEGLPFITQEEDIKASIFHLYHPTTQAWLNVRHRAYNKYQPKGALNSGYACHNEINWHYMQSGGNGIWTIEWEQRENITLIRFESPDNGVSVLSLSGGAAAWREIRHGSGDARIPFNTPATVVVLELTGTYGDAVWCQY